MIRTDALKGAMRNAALEAARVGPRILKQQRAMARAPKSLRFKNPGFS